MPCQLVTCRLLSASLCGDRGSSGLWKDARYRKRQGWWRLERPGTHPPRRPSFASLVFPIPQPFILFHISRIPFSPTSLFLSHFRKTILRLFHTLRLFSTRSSPQTLSHSPIVVIYRFRPNPINRNLPSFGHGFLSRHPTDRYLNCNHVKLPLRCSSLRNCYAVSPSPFAQPPRPFAPRTSCFFCAKCPSSTAVQGSKKSQGASRDACLQRLY